MLDADLALLYGVQTKVLVQTVKRNAARFPADFMFQLDAPEWAALRSQFVTSNGRGGRRTALVAKHAASDSVASRCCSYLSRGLVRDFRNAFSHANWKYNASFTGLECWVLADARERNGPMRQFEVSQADLDFWQVLSRGVAYAAYEQLRGTAPLNR